MNTLKSSREKESTSAAEPGRMASRYVLNFADASTAKFSTDQPYRFTKRLGSTTYRVVVHFNPNAKDTASEKIARLVRNEALGKVVNL